MKFPHVCTIYNRYRDGQVERWQRTVLQDVFWDCAQGISMRTAAIDSEDSGLILIPTRGRTGYLSPKKFAALQKKVGHWTLQQEDRIAFGDIEYEIDETNRLAGLEKEFDDVRTITKINRHALGRALDHWEIEVR